MGSTLLLFAICIDTGITLRGPQCYELGQLMHFHNIVKALRMFEESFATLLAFVKRIWF